MKASKFHKEEYKNWRNYDEEQFQERDFQRQKAYDAEHAIRDKMSNNKKYDSREEIQKRVDKICSYKWFTSRWGNHQIRVIHKTHGSWAYGNYHKKHIRLPEWAWNDLIVLHELAHAITPPETGGRHGRYWAATFLELVEKVMSKADYIVLRESFKTHGVKYSQKRRLSEETKEKMRDHMKQVRQKSPIFNK